MNAYIQEIILGDEPPLLTNHTRSGKPDRRHISFRWLFGTILTALTSLFLMGGALFLAVESRTDFLEKAHIVEDAQDEEIVDTGPVHAADGKGDRITNTVKTVRNRQVIEVSTVQDKGNRRLILKKPYTRLLSSLSLHNTDQYELPSFNPVSIFSGTETATALTAGLNAGGTLYTEQVEGEIILQSFPFPTELEPASEDAQPDHVIQNIVEISAPFLDVDSEEHFNSASSYINPNEITGGFSVIERFINPSVRLITENVTAIVPTTALDEIGHIEEKIVTAREGEYLADLLMENQTTSEIAIGIARIYTKQTGQNSLQSFNRVRLAFETSPLNPLLSSLIRVSIYGAESHILTIAKSDSGVFLAAFEPESITDIFSNPETTTSSRSSSGPRLSLYESLYQTGFENNISRASIDELVRIFTFDVDFQSRVRPGDAIELFFTENDKNQQSDILFAEITASGATRRFYKFQTPDDSAVDYYDAGGKSAKKFLMRQPIHNAKFRSAFGWRKHPILGKVRLHRGVDWSAPYGTPIMASGNGTISRRKWTGGYGKYIKIRHTNGYETGYAHMSGYAVGLAEGDTVRQGQVIGFVGSTGLSKGNHLHYEVEVNRNHVDPMRIRLPRGRILTGNMLDSFEVERRKINNLLGKIDKPTLALRK